MEDDDSAFSKLSNDVILKIFTLLEDDPRNWARLSCVCTKFHSLISSTCYRSKCIASLSSGLLSLSSSDGWPSLFKLSVCCPGLLHSGVLLDNSDFGLHRELGVGVDVHHSDDLGTFSSSSSLSSSQIHLHHHPDDHNNNNNNINSHGDLDDGGNNNNNNNNNNLFEGWSLYDDLYLDTLYDNSESSTPMEVTTGVVTFDTKFVDSDNRNEDDDNDSNNDFKRRKVVNDNDSGNDDGGEVVARRLHRSHLASGVWNLSREQGMKLLASRFRGDCLYISDWPGCVHGEDKRKYMLFRGVFSEFKKTRVWRTIKDGNHRSKTDLNCAFCSCNQTWDLHSAFCLKRGFGFHDDGEPVVRAYVCENGHVSGAWTDFPLFT